MKKRSIVFAIALLLCLVAAHSVFAVEYPNIYRHLQVEEGYTLKDALWYNPTVYCVEVLQFNQAYLYPDDPVTYFMAAAQYTDEQIEEEHVIFQSFFEPTYVGRMNFEYSADVEALAQSLGYEFPQQSWMFSLFFSTVQDIMELFPMGIGRANSYDTFRRCALQLAVYSMKNGSSPSFDTCNAYIEQILAYYEQQFNDAMAAEAEAAMTVEQKVEQGAEESAPAPAETN